MSEATPNLGLVNETAVAGSILIDPRCLSAVRKIIGPEHFTVEWCWAVFKAACELADSGQPIDPVLIRNKAREFDVMLEHETLEQAMALTPTAANAELYAKAMLKDAKESGKVKQISTISAPDLQKVDLPPVTFLIDTMLPEGTSILSAASKIGKSWMVLHAGLCIAAGVPFMGHQTTQSGVLYLALEDSLSRLQDRMHKILNGRPAPPRFFFATEAPTLDNGLLDALDGHVRQCPDTKLIIIDTLQKIRGQALPREPAYAQDYREMGTIKEHMAKKGVSVFFIHHNRKMKDEDDPFNMISGTNAIMGAADTIWVITKGKREEQEATLHITGRDVQQTDTAIRFDKDSWMWQSMGAADWLAEQRARLEYNQSPIVKTIKKLLSQNPDGRWDGTASELMDAGKYIARTHLAPTAQKLGYALKNLDKPLLDYDGILHVAPSNGTGGKKHYFYYQNLDQFEELSEQEELPFPNM